MTTPVADKVQEKAAKAPKVPTPLEQYQAEFMKDKNSVGTIAPGAIQAWEKAYLNKQFIATQPNPGRVTGFYRDDPTATPLPFGPVSPWRNDQLRKERNDFTAALETAYEVGKEQIPMSLLLEFGLDELKAFGGEDFLNVNITQLSEAMMWGSEIQKMDQAINDEVDKRWKVEMRGQTFFENMHLGTAGLFDASVSLMTPFRTNYAREVWDDQQGPGLTLDEVKLQVLNEFNGQRDQNFEDDIAEWRVNQRKMYMGGARLGSPGRPDMEEQLDKDEAEMRQLIAAGGDPGDVLNTRTGLANAFAGLLGGMGIAMNAVATGIGQQLWVVDAITPGEGPYQFFVNRTRADQEEVKAAWDQYANTSDEKWIARASSLGVAQALDAMKTDDPESYQTLLDMADGNETMAAGFFGMSVTDNPDIKEQVSGMVESLQANERQFVNDMSEQDFRFSSELMDVVSMWGRNVPGRLGTAFTLLLTDQEYWDDVTSMEWKKVWKDVGENASALDFQPSAVVGLDGSLVGLVMDLGLGIAFDPTTWIFGPKFGAAAKGKVGITSAARVEQAMGSAVVQKMMDDIYLFAQSPSRSAITSYLVGSWLDDIAIARISAITGYTTESLGKRPWNAKYGKVAHEVEVGQILKALPEEDLARVLAVDGGVDAAKITTEAVDRVVDGWGLADDIKAADGFTDVGEITISRADGTIHVTDGVKRLLTAQRMGINRVPMKLTVVDDIAKGKVLIKGYDDAASTFIKSVADGTNELAGPLLPKGSPRIREDVISQAKLVRNREPGIGVGSVETQGGNLLEVRRSTNEGTVLYTVQDGSGNVRAAITAEEGIVLDSKGMSMAIDQLPRGAMEQIWDIARAQGDEFILQVGKSPSTSQAALDFAQRYAQKLLEDATGVLRTKGASLEDLIPGGLKKELADFAEGKGPVTVRPDSVLPGEFLFGKLPQDRLQGILKDFLERGGQPTGGASRTSLMSMRGRVGDAVKRGNLFDMRSFFTKMNTTRRMVLHGPNAMRKIMDQVLILWGDDVGRSSMWAERFMDYTRRSQLLVDQNNARLAILRPMWDEIRVLRDQTGGIWDDVSRLSDDAAKANLTAVDNEMAALKASQSAFEDTQRLATATGDEFGAANAGQGAKDTAKQIEQGVAYQRKLQETLTEKLKAFDRKAREVYKEVEAMPNTIELSDLIRDMWIDFNQRYIVPKWKNQIKKHPEIYDKKLEIVKWEHLRKGRVESGSTVVSEVKGGKNILTEDLAFQMEQAGITNPEGLVSKLRSVPDTPMAVEVPLSPLDMLAASTSSGKNWILYTQNAAADTVRTAVQTLHQAWVIDKVFRFATAMTVSGDELLRIFHTGGNDAVARWLKDRAIFADSRVNQLLHGGQYGNGTLSPSLTKPFARDAVQRGARYSPRVEERLRELSENTLKYRELERVFHDDAGLGWTDIMPDDAIYLDAARQWTGGFLQESGFRAFLRGKDDFIEWFNSVDGQSLREATVLQVRPGARSAAPTTGVVSSAEEMYKGWKAVFEDAILSKATKDNMFNEVLAEFKSVAERIDQTGGKAIDLPDWVFDHMGPVRGVQRNARAGGSLFKLTDSFFNRFFLDPVNYRRGFLADMVGKAERARLESLFASQGKNIISDAEIARSLGYQGLAGASRTGVKEFITERALAQGMIPESYVDDLVQKAADAEIEHMLYVAEQSRRVGNVATGTLFPFGKPYADMMGFWGRETMRKPHYRGRINEMNYNRMGDLLTAKGNFNPRTPALVSRLASTDFTVDQGWTGQVDSGESQGLLPGSDKTDLSPLLFLPTKDDNVFYALVPGMGYIPMWALDYVLANYGNADTDPLGYQELVSKVGDVIGGANYGNADPKLSLFQRFLGGGTSGQVAETILDAYALFGSNGGFPAVSTMLGQPDREIDRGRTMSALLADPEEWKALAELKDDAAIGVYIDALANRADSASAQNNLQEQVSRFLLPANSKFSGELDQLYDVWMTAGDAFPQLVPYEFNADTATPEQRKRYAASIRKSFFKLPQWERDRMIAEKPELAVNLISTWEWTDMAFDVGTPGTNLSYRTDGSREGLAQHQLYINQGIIRPLSPQERARRIIGLAMSAKESTAKRIYESVAEDINRVKWEYSVSEETKTMLDGLMALVPEFGQILDIRTGQELWQAWGSKESDFEDFIAEALDVAQERGMSRKKEDLTAYDYLRSNIKIPQEEQPWSATWPGNDIDSLPKRYANMVFPDGFFTDETRTLANSVGVQLSPNMTGAQLYQGAQQVVVSMQGPLSAYVDPAYQTYIGSRSAAYRVVDDQLRAVGLNEMYDREWGQTVLDFLSYLNSISDRYRQEKLGVPGPEQVNVQNRYMVLMQTANDKVITDWDQLWKMRYEKSFGPLEWTPPEPLSPFEGDTTTVIGTAYKPVFKTIIDGDSLVVRESAGSQQYHEVRLLGTRARDFGLDDEGAQVDKERLMDALQQALTDGDSIYLVRQPDVFGNVDMFGRELAWLWIGDKPYYYPDELLPNRDPSGSGS